MDETVFLASPPIHAHTEALYNMLNAIRLLVDLAHLTHQALDRLGNAVFQFDQGQAAGPENTYHTRTHRLRPFDFDEYTDADTWNLFRFERQQLLRLHACLYPNLPWQRIAYVGLVNTLQALCITLRRLAFPVRLTDLEREFRYDQFALSHIINFVCIAFPPK